MQNEILTELKGRELNLYNELREIKVIGFKSAEDYNSVSKHLMKVQQQISIIESNKK